MIFKNVLQKIKIKRERERAKRNFGFTPLEISNFDGIKRRKQWKSLTGFTLIELLIVIAIIGLLSSVVLASLNSARKKARDARRLADFNEIRKALELYYDKNGRYPNAAHSGCYDGWETSCDTAGNFIDELRTEGFFSKTPLDPINISTGYGEGYFYGYYRYSAGTNGCPFVHAVLAINQFEMFDNPNKGISAKCDPAPPNRDWYPEWDYSVLLPE